MRKSTVFELSKLTSLLTTRYVKTKILAKNIDAMARQNFLRHIVFPKYHILFFFIKYRTDATQGNNT